MGHGNSGKRKADNSLDFVANTNAQDNGLRRKGKPPPRGGGPSPNPKRLSYLLNQPCPKHGSQDKPATHLWKDCYIMQELKNSDFFGMIMERVVVQAPDLMAQVTVEAVSVQVSTVIRVGMKIKAIRATKVVIIIREISSSSSRVTRATRSS